MARSAIDGALTPDIHASHADGYGGPIRAGRPREGTEWLSWKKARRDRACVEMSPGIGSARERGLMKRYVASACAAVVLATGSSFAQQKATITGVPDIPFTSVPNFLKLPPGRIPGRVGRRRHQFEGQHLRLSPPRHDAAVRVRSQRQLRQGNRQGLLRLRVRPLGPRRQGRQHLDRRRRHEHGHQVQPRRTRC